MVCDREIDLVLQKNHAKNISMPTPFTYAEGSILVRLLIAHIITDFFLQTSKGIAAKENRMLASGSFWLHGLYTGIVAALLVWEHFAWLPLLVLTLSHLVIDYAKVRVKASLKQSEKELALFVTDQVLHLLMIAIVWLMMIKGFAKCRALFAGILPDYRLMLRVLGYLVVIAPVTYLVKFLTAKWQNEVIDPNQSLRDAGKWIGILERVIVLTLVFSGQFTAIGFLATSKSILRLIDKPDATENNPGKPWSSRKHTEYVLIGTFLSFGAAIVTGLFINYLLTLP